MATNDVKNVVTKPGVSVSLQSAFVADATGCTPAISTQQTNFEQNKHLLSDKPMHRPNRTKPLDD